MYDKHKLISEIDGRLRAGEDALENAYTALGRYAADKAQEKFPDGNIRTLLDQVVETESAIENNDRMEKRIQEAVQRLDDLKKDLRQLENQS